MKFKSKLLLLITLILSLCLSLVGCKKEDNSSNLKTIKLNEVVRSVFYAPMYVAINEGFFEEEGLNIDLSTGQGADKVMQNVLSKNADIGFCGPEQVVYIYNQGREDFPVLFAGLTKRDGSFLVSKSSEKDFDWKTLKGKSIIGGRPGGVPEMALEYVLNKNNIVPNKDVNMVTNIDFTATAGAFKSGAADYVALFEPTASMLEKEGSGKIVASIGESSGEMPYTCFFATKSYIENNQDVIESFTKALYKGQTWFKEHSSEEVADSILSFFPGTDKDIIISVIDNYKKIDALYDNPIITEEGLNHLMDVISDYDKSLIETRPPFNDIVNNSFANKVLGK
ncbi:ABC transporter substrate-binding protein [Clostridium sp. Ade.TY]|uniref:ABC transporter substrate-binding protein n=1 Tax=Clostridium sp. Ade.TY TaxID=1391647 RepID=UPI00040002F0|nr:ABC transporter substrate-binding protein [Clostridium sp. Ade.TY]